MTKSKDTKSSSSKSTVSSSTKAASTPSYKDIPIPPIPPIDPDEAERRAAAARAYALQTTQVRSHHPARKKRKSSSSTTTTSPSSFFHRSNSFTTRTTTPPTTSGNLDLDEEYTKFVQSLLQDDTLSPSLQTLDDDEDDMEYKSSEDESESQTTGPRDRTESVDSRLSASAAPMGVQPTTTNKAAATPPPQSMTPPSHSSEAPGVSSSSTPGVGLDLNELQDLDWELELDPLALEAELGALLEEELEAAESTLLKSTVVGGGDGGGGSGSASLVASGSSGTEKVPSIIGSGGGGATATSTSMVGGTPGEGNSFLSAPNEESNLSTASRSSVQATVPPTAEQMTQLKTLMSQHYQLLLQQAILSVRAAHGNKFRQESPTPMMSVPPPANVTNIQTGLSNTATTGTTSSSTLPQTAPLHENITTLKRFKPLTKRRREADSFFLSGETQDDLGEILDGAVTMLQDLDQNRKDAIRYCIQMKRLAKSRQRGDGSGGRRGVNALARGASGVGGLYPTNAPPAAARSILVEEKEEIEPDESYENKWLTRSAFQMLQLESQPKLDRKEEERNSSENASWGGNGTFSASGIRTSFGVKGLARLKDSFAVIDNSLNANTAGGMIDSAGIDVDGINVLEQTNVSIVFVWLTK